MMATYIRKAFAVEAVQVTQPKWVTTPDGQAYARPGAWIVTEANGDVHVCDEEIFRLKFELAKAQKT